VSRRPLLLAYLPAVLWAVWILYLGSRTFEPLPELILPADKLAHFTLYGVLGLLAALGWRWAGHRPAVWIPMLASILTGAVDELRQRSLATRTADVYDWLVDVAAILLAFALLAWRSSPDFGARRPGK
jgi:VanZ family protein